MAEMEAGGRELIVQADESELLRRVPSSPTLICVLIISARTVLLELDVSSAGIH